MARPVTLFTGQWADLPFEEVCRLAASWGYDGVEIACSGDHFEVDRAVADPGYVAGRREILDRHGLQVFAISNHLVGQAVCDDPVDARHRAILPQRIWGDGVPEGVRQRAAQEMKDTARAAAALGVRTVVGFTGSSIWPYVAMFPPVPASTIEAGYTDFADRWNPVLDVFDDEGVRFAHEVHPSEIAYDYWSTQRTLDAIGHREAFGLNWDPSHMVWQEIDPVGFLWDFQDRIYHVDCKDTRMRTGNGRGDRLRRPAVHRVGGRRHGPPAGCGGGGGVRPPHRGRPAGGGLRRGVQHAAVGEVLRLPSSMGFPSSSTSTKLSRAEPPFRTS